MKTTQRAVPMKTEEKDEESQLGVRSQSSQSETEGQSVGSETPEPGVKI